MTTTMIFQTQALEMLQHLMTQGYTQSESLIIVRGSFSLTESEVIQVLETFHAHCIADIKRRAECPLAQGLAFLIPQAGY